MGQFKPEKHVDRLASGERPFARPITGKDNPIRPIDHRDGAYMPTKPSPDSVKKYVCMVGKCSGLDLREKEKDEE